MGRRVDGRDHPGVAAERGEHDIGLRPDQRGRRTTPTRLDRADRLHPVDVDELHVAALAAADRQEASVGRELAHGHEEGHLHRAVVDRLERAAVGPEDLVAGPGARRGQDGVRRRRAGGGAVVRGRRHRPTSWRSSAARVASFEPPQPARAAAVAATRRNFAFIYSQYTTESIAGSSTLAAMRFERVLVVGAGQMGAGIAQVMAASGRAVLLHDAAPGAVEQGPRRRCGRASRSSRRRAPTHDPGRGAGAGRAGRRAGRRPT